MKRAARIPKLFRLSLLSADPGAVHDRRCRASLVRRLLSSALLAAVLAAATGCASVPSFRTHSDLPQRKSGIRSVGLLPPVIILSEEQARFGLNKLVHQVLWSDAAVDAVSRAFSAEMAADRIPLVQLSTDDPAVKELAELYTAVELSIQKHAWETRSGEMPPREPFPEKVRVLDYSLGPVRELMERHHVDAVWFVRGFNLLPTAGTRVKEGVEVLLSIVAAMGGAPVPVMQLKKIELRAALIDWSGSVLYYGVADEERGGQPVDEVTAAYAPEGEVPASAMTADRAYLAVDLRDPQVARHYLRAALKGYRQEALR